MMSEELIKATINIVEGIDVCGEDEATAKELLISYVEQLQQENEELKETLKGTTHCFDEEEHQKLKEENEELKRRLNWIAFGGDAELALRYLKRIGYVGFDDEKRNYINTHNNEPYRLEYEQEKGYYIENDRLDEYTKQLEKQKEQLEQENDDLKDNIKGYEQERQALFASLNQQNILPEFEKWLEEELKIVYRDCGHKHNILQEVMDKLQELKGAKK